MSATAVGAVDQTLLDPVVVQDLSAVTGPRGNLYATLCASFLRAAPDDLADARTFAQRGDWAALAQALHRFRGAATTVGAKAVADCCGALEQRLRTPPPPRQVDEGLARVDAELVRTRAAMSRLTSDVEGRHGGALG